MNYMANDEDLSELDKMLLLIINFSGSVKATRLQKLGILGNVALGHNHDSIHNPYYFGGFSDEIEEESTFLHEQGYLRQTPGGLVLSPTGVKCVEELKNKNEKEATTIKGIVETLRRYSDKEVTAITYKMFPDLADKSIIREEVDKISQRLPIIELEYKDDE